MKKTGIKLLTIFLILFGIASWGWAMDLPDYSGDIYVQDFAGMISPELENEIKAAARLLEDRTTAQISVVTITSLEGNDLEGYANELFRKWGLGHKERDNGVLFLIALEEQRFRIEVGYGLEGRINDAKAGDILRTTTPYFREGNFDKGIAVAFNALAREISTEYETELVQVSEAQEGSNATGNQVEDPQEVQIPFGVKVIFVLFLIYLAIFHPDRLLTIIYLFSRGGPRGGSGGGGSRRGGGGSSGGGGASGRW
ncbi:MAG: TPM domain-containing protein [Clostridia bacterium]|nr:TPM domain-containing protein [Clostridia bacterium]